MVEGNYVGTDYTGTAALGVQADGAITVFGTNNTIGGTVSGAGNVAVNTNSGQGIWLDTGSNNLVAGNFVGTNKDGSATIGVAQFDVYLVSASNNTIGGTTAAARNVIAGSSLIGIYLTAGGSGNLIEGNYVGTDATGTTALANPTGIEIDTANNTVGGTASGAGNLVSGNSGSGIVFFNTGATGNVVQGNYLGTNAAGTAALANHGDGVTIRNSADANTIGGSAAGAGNVISGNLGSGVNLFNSADNNVIQGNCIGTNAAGSAAIANAGGVAISNSADNNTFGGPTTAFANLISGNSGYGIGINPLTGNVFENDYVGTGAGGSGTIANTSGALNLGNNVTVLASGSFDGAVLNQGTIDIANSPNSLAITGNYTQTSAAALDIAVGGTASFDQLSVSGTASLAGTLNLSLVNNFLPDLTQSFPIISAGTLSGSYATVNNVSIDGHALFSTQYTATALTLQGTSIVVNSTGDSGQSGSGTPHTGNTINGVGEITLRSAIQYADSLSGTSYIFFDIPTSDGGYNSGSGGYWSIAPNSALPALSDSVTLDATSQPGYSTHPVIELDGANVGAESGLSLVAGFTTVRGLAINRFGGDGIDSSGAGNTLVGNYLGTDVTGQVALGNGQYGILVNFGTNTTIGGTTAADRNVISGNTSDGILVNAGPSNLIEGNYIGVTADGTGNLGNGARGIRLGGSGSTGNTIGGTVSGAGNVISGNTGYGVEITSSATGNLVEGNYVGLNAAGTSALGNGADGILLNSSTNNTIGGTTTGARNVISGNAIQGIELTASTNNLIEGNYIGTDASGANAIGNTAKGIYIGTGSANNIVGGTTTGARNVISGNALGIQTNGTGASGNLIEGNYIGTNAAGTAAIAQGGGVQFNTSGNTLGGTTTGAGNVIAGSTNVGVGLTANNNLVQGNLIGTTADGSAALGNTTGLLIQDGGSGNTVGGTTAAARNVISGNTGIGSGGAVIITGLGTNGNLVEGNYIGLNAAGTAALANHSNGVFVADEARTTPSAAPPPQQATSLPATRHTPSRWTGRSTPRFRTT